MTDKQVLMSVICVGVDEFGMWDSAEVTYFCCVLHSSFDFELRMRLVFWLCFITMAQGSDGKSGVGDKSLQELIDQINSEPHYRVVPRVEYESLVRMKTNPSFGHPPVSTPKPVVHPAVSTPNFFPVHQSVLQCCLTHLLCIRTPTQTLLNFQLLVEVNHNKRVR